MHLAYLKPCPQSALANPAPCLCGTVQSRRIPALANARRAAPGERPSQPATGEHALRPELHGRQGAMRADSTKILFADEGLDRSSAVMRTVTHILYIRMLPADTVPVKDELLRLHYTSRLRLMVKQAMRRSSTGRGRWWTSRTSRGRSTARG